jgi:hypothetical protein
VLTQTFQREYVIKMADGPYELNEDGTAKDPVAFREALRNDPERMQALEEEPDIKDVVLGDDIHAFQELIKNAYHVSAIQEPGLDILKFDDLLCCPPSRADSRKHLNNQSTCDYNTIKIDVSTVLFINQ